ncbi:MAG: gliding motility-associated C-terminal domain-containing protein [Bacteroidia bacterium]
MLKFRAYALLFFVNFLLINHLNSQSAVAIALNEYQVTNTTNSNLDNYFQPSDWVELYNNHTATVSLAGYYLSNERTNLKKWQFPSTFTMNVGQYSVIWMSGRNESKIINGLHHCHTNFTIDQCKNQWIILTAPNGVVRDSIFVQKTKENHTRGRMNGMTADYSTVGVSAWRVYTAPTFSAINNLPAYIDYCPTPQFTEKAGIGTVTTPTFEIYTHWEGALIDTSCYRVYFTTDGSDPTPFPPSIEYIDPATPLIVPPTQLTMFRAICYPKITSTLSPAFQPSYCETNYLPSFIQTNTYFCEAGVLEPDFSKDYGVLSIAIHSTSANWFQVGTPAASVHVEYFDMKSGKEKKFITEGYAQMSKPVNESWLSFQKGFDLNIDDRRGFGCNFEYPVFNVNELGVSTRTVFNTLQVSGGDFEAHSAPASFTASGLSEGTAIRDVFMQTLAAKYNIDVNPLHIKPVRVFINGKYVGAYNLKEKYDVYYEEFYNKQTEKEKTTMLFYHNGEGSVNTHTSTNNWKGSPLVDTYSFTTSYPLNTNNVNQFSQNYVTLKSRLNIPNFIDYSILNSFAQNSNLYNYNIAMAKGSNTLTGGGKWHHYLWNTPAVFQYTAIALNSLIYNTAISSPCAISQPTYPISPNGYNGQGKMFWSLMDKNGGNAEFRRDYLMRYQDLLNGPLSCDYLLSHWETINNIYRDEMKKHEDPGTPPLPGAFVTQTDFWDTNMAVLKRAILARCEHVPKSFTQFVSCYGLVGPYNITVDVEPAGAGTVKLNTATLPNYVWSGNYFKGPMSFKATPIDSNYVFDHWELENHTETTGRPLSLDSIGINFSNPNGEKVVAVFTDRQNDAVLPTGFSPNGDGNNDVFGILGAGKYAREFEMRIWNRWGQEVFVSNDPTMGWDGNFNGAQAQTGVYAYLITYKNIFNETKVLKGNVTLIR